MDAQKLELLAYLLEEEGIASPEMPTISPRESSHNLPLSFAQQRLWFLNQLEPDSPFYNISAALRLNGLLNVAALEQSFNEIIQRHEILRATFNVVDGEAIQVINPQEKLTIKLIDLTALPAQKQETEAQQLANQEAGQPFDLATGPLVRSTLLCLDEAEHILLFTMHHIISDGWSTDILVREVATLYECYCNGKPSPLPELPIQYADYAVWQRQWLQGEVLTTHIDYWKQQLQDNPPVLELPTDRPRPHVQSYRGSIQSFQLPQDVTVALKTLSQQEGSTLFMTLLAAFKVLLYRYTSNGDIVVGSPIANRDRSELESLIGFFVNTLVLCTNLSDNPTFRELLGRVREVTLGAYEHQDLPFDLLVEELKPQRDLSHTPLFQVMFVLQNAPMSAVELSGLTLQALQSETSTAKFDLTLLMQETESGIRGALEYNTDLFDAATIAQMAEHLQTLLAGIVANPEQQIAQLPLLTANEQHQLLMWNQTHAEYSLDKCIHELFEEQVEKTPDAVAVVFADQQLTYQELNTKVNQLAQHLQKLGVSPDILVGICVERSLEMVVGLLGILKAGGAYVPLDPAYPSERLVFMLSDAGVSVLLTQKHLQDVLPQTSAQIVCLDQNWDTIAQHSNDNPNTTVQPDNLAYVIYTSGSTGQPKGVMVPHRAICNHMLWMQTEFPVTASDRVLQKTPFSFDASVWEFYAPLLTGGQLILAKPGGHQDSQYLLDLIAQQQVSIVQFVPSQLRSLLAEQKIYNCHSLRRVFCGGEALAIDLQASFFSILPNVELCNLYGPTEATIDTTYWQCQPQDEQKTVPIGKAISNTQIYLLDSYLQPVPIGVPGEIYIGGAGLARGYLNRADLTSEKFISNPFLSGTKLYKTGDLARYRPDGTIEFIERIDGQVKLRGFRIELGEIETQLTQHLHIKQAVVLIREDVPGEKRLVAYIVPSQEQSPTVSELRSFLKNNLPDYMVPSVFITLNTLPFLPNGKLDRKALPAPDTARPDLQAVFATPRTPVEETLMRIWSDVLRLEKVGINDNFFELGGHSLLIVQLFARLRSAFQIDLPFQTLFDAPTVATLAERLETARQASSSANVTHSNFDLKAEAVLDRAINCEGKQIEEITNPACIFLTGTTGFLGAFLLDELLQQTQADIYCLVRAANAEEGKQKLRRTLESYLIWNESQSSRIIPVVGDLSQPLLGLSQVQFTALARKIDVIYHNGAWVHHASPYSTLKAANVLGTQEVLRLASQIKIKPVHFISTISVFSAPIGTGVKLVCEESNLDDYPVPEGGYTQSKWVAEKLVAIAHHRGLPVSIYRPGRISGHSKTGAFNPNDFFYRLLIGCVQLGMVPEREFFDSLAPVDYVSKAIVYLSRQQKSSGKAFHVLNQEHLNLKILFNIVRYFGYSLQQISEEQWQLELIKIAENFPNHPLYPLIPLFTVKKSNKAALIPEASNFVALEFDCSNTQQGLIDTSIVCPKTDEKLLATYFSYLIRNKFIPATKVTEIYAKNNF